jgi:hypothetical protein
MRDPIHQYGVFDGDISAMPIRSGYVAPLQAGNGKYGSLTASPENYLRWVWAELHCPQMGRFPAPFSDWLGEATCKLLGL